MEATLKKRKGQTLVETIVALSVLMMGLMGLIALLTRSFAISNFVSDNYAATYLAAEGIEVVKNLIDHNIAEGLISGSTVAWNEGLVGNCPCEIEWSDITLSSAGTPRKLLLNTVTGLYSYDVGGMPTKFVRTIYIESIADDPNDPTRQDHLRVNSIVAWTSSGGITGVPIVSEVNLEDHFFNPK